MYSDFGERYGVLFGFFPIGRHELYIVNVGEQLELVRHSLSSIQILPYKQLIIKKNAKPFVTKFTNYFV